MHIWVSKLDEIQGNFMVGTVRTVYSFIKIYQVISDVDIFGIAK